MLFVRLKPPTTLNAVINLPPGTCSGKPTFPDAAPGLGEYLGSIFSYNCNYDVCVFCLVNNIITSTTLNYLTERNCGSNSTLHLLTM